MSVATRMRGAQQREGDGAVGAHVRRAVDLRRLVDLAGDRLQAGQDRVGGEGDRDEHGYRDHPQERGVGAAQPVGLGACRAWRAGRACRSSTLIAPVFGSSIQRKMIAVIITDAAHGAISAQRAMRRPGKRWLNSCATPARSAWSGRRRRRPRRTRADHHRAEVRVLEQLGVVLQSGGAESGSRPGCSAGTRSGTSRRPARSPRTRSARPRGRPSREGRRPGRAAAAEGLEGSAWAAGSGRDWAAGRRSRVRLRRGWPRRISDGRGDEVRRGVEDRGSGRATSSLMLRARDGSPRRPRPRWTRPGRGSFGGLVLTGRRWRSAGSGRAPTSGRR